ncbi:hypothetical protein HY523_01575 [Candidatus Berkelbacteria bacterium]|nr:hypothetical protein [Candidatus Berkelbacteria bacterium]
MDQLELIKTIGTILKRLKIPYLITGGLAVTVWGRPRFTADIDLVVELLPQQVEPLARALRTIDKDVYVDEDFIRDALERRGEFNFLHPDSGLKVDFLILDESDPFDRERLRRRISKRVGRTQLFFSTPEDLILVKLRWFGHSQSTRHLEDSKSIMAIQGENLDQKYITSWAKRHGTLEIWQSLS